MEQILVSYLKHLRIPVSGDYVKKIILSHPDYPSLLSVSDALDRLGVPCQIGRIEEEHLTKIEFPFLIHLDSSREGFVLVKSKDDLSRDHIDLTHWKGIVLRAQPVNALKDSEHNNQYKKERLTKNIALTLTISLFSVLIIPLLQAFSWENLILLITSIFGSILGYVLLAKDLGITYKPVESFCNTSTRVNCDKILNSEGGRIVSFFGLSEAVISYFAFQLILSGIVLPFLDTTAPYLWVLMAGSTLSIPVILYSMYYQAIKAKTWCRLCMLVNTILVVQTVFFGFLITNGIISIQSIELIPFLFSSCLLLVIAASVVLAKANFHKLNEAVNAEIVASRLKNDSEVFSSLLMQGQKMDVGSFDKKMMIGNPNTSIQLIMVASLHCYPCKLAFEDVLELVESFPNQIGIEVRFVLSTNLVHSVPATTFLIQYWEQFICGTKEESMNTEKLVKDWYANMNVAEFEKLYPKVAMINKNEGSGLELQHHQWIIKHDISRTPTFLLNDYPFPLKYSIKDLDNLMIGLEELLLERKKEQVTKTKELVN